jgi:hypothetical protein
MVSSTKATVASPVIRCGKQNGAFVARLEVVTKGAGHQKYDSRGSHDGKRFDGDSGEQTHHSGRSAIPIRRLSCKLMPRCAALVRAVRVPKP